MNKLTCKHCGYSWVTRPPSTWDEEKDGQYTPKCCPICKRYLNRSRYTEIKGEGK